MKARARERQYFELVSTARSGPRADTAVDLAAAAQAMSRQVSSRDRVSSQMSKIVSVQAVCHLEPGLRLTCRRYPPPYVQTDVRGDDFLWPAAGHEAVGPKGCHHGAGGQGHRQVKSSLRMPMCARCTLSAELLTRPCSV